MLSLLLDYKKLILIGVILSSSYFGVRKVYKEYSYKKRATSTTKELDCLKKAKLEEKELAKCLNIVY